MSRGWAEVRGGRGAAPAPAALGPGPADPAHAAGHDGEHGAARVAPGAPGGGPRWSVVGILNKRTKVVGNSENCKVSQLLNVVSRGFLPSGAGP